MTGTPGRRPGRSAPGARVCRGGRGRRRGRLTAAGGAVLLLLAAAACGGEDARTREAGAGTRGGPRTADTAAASFDVEDGELRAFARASAELEELRRETLAEVQEARDAQERKRIRRRFRARRDSLLRAAGLAGGAERYDEIRGAVESSERLRERWRDLRGRLRQNRKGGGG